MAVVKLKRIGFLVMEIVGDFECPLALEIDQYTPLGGLLVYRDIKHPAFLFPDRKSAREAIDRTDHYRKAFSSGHPDKAFCKIVPVEAATDE